MREIVDCFDIDSEVREVNLKKGVQITYSTALECGAFYYMGYVKSLPMMYVTADKELADFRIENNFLPMLLHSDMSHIIQSSDIGNRHKTGKSRKQLQFAGGGYLTPYGAKNADKMRQASIAVMLKDEIDAWPLTVGKDGDPGKLTDDRCSGFWDRRKIFRGSTPLIKGISQIDFHFRRGDQRYYYVRCKHCGFPQVLRWKTVDKKTGVVGGFQWDLEDGTLILESVRYCCQECGRPHYEYDKERLFSPEAGAVWKPTAKPAEHGIRSYHLPALYSPIGMAPWSKCVSDYLQAVDPETERVIDIGKHQTFYNNILAASYEVRGSKVTREQVSLHRRVVYRFGQIPNEYAEKYSGSRILFLTCTVDVHDDFLAVAVIGWCVSARCYLIDYFRYEPLATEKVNCTETSCSVWGRLRELIEEKVYEDRYRIAVTFIDAGYANDTVTTFCKGYEYGVYPILGRDRPSKNQKIEEFGEFKTKSGIVGFRIVVDHYKDRMAPVLRREWIEEFGVQKENHFNAPVDVTEAQLAELTVETRVKKVDEHGNVSFFWHRPGNARNELWDLLGYGYCAVEVIAWIICIKVYGMEAVDWVEFWRYAQLTENDGHFGRE